MTHFLVQREAPRAHEMFGTLSLGGRNLCRTLEDIPRNKKVWGQTAIPNGTYRLSLVEKSGFNSRYQKRWGAEWHPGIITINDVPGFTYIRMHMGNSHLDTAGCPLVGTRTSEFRGGWLHESRIAYERIYPIVRDSILAGDTCISFKGAPWES